MHLWKRWGVGKQTAGSTSFLVNGKQVYAVNKILDQWLGYHGCHKHVTEFFITWEGYGLEHDSWEPEANLLDPETIGTMLHCMNSIRTMSLLHMLCSHSASCALLCVLVLACLCGVLCALDICVLAAGVLCALYVLCALLC